MRGDIEKYYQTYAKSYDLGSHFGPSCVIDSRGGAFFSRPVFRNLWGVPPWTDFGIPWDTLDPILSLVWKIVIANLLQNSKIPEQQMSPTTPSKKQARINKKLRR